MIIKEAKHKRCKECGKHIEQISPTVYGCDNCKKEFKGDYLKITIFNKNEEDSKLCQFCCWKCVFEFIPSIECDYFVGLPFLHYDTNIEGCKVEDFLKQIK